MTILLRIIFFVGDLLLLNLSIFISIWLFRGDASTGLWNNVYLVVFSNLAWLFLVMVSNPYNVNKSWTLSRIFKSQVAFLFIHLMVVASLILLFKQHYTPFQVFLIYLVFLPLFFIFRIMSFYFRKVFTDELPIKNYALIGRNELASEIRKFFMMNPESGYKFQGYLDFTSGSFSMADIREFCLHNEVHELYCCVDVGKEQLQELINFGLDSLIKVKVIASPTAGRQQISLEQYDHLPGIDLATVHLDETRNQILKRIFDMLFSALFIVTIAWWLFPIIGILIKLDSKGPVFFIQPRSGRGNRPFNCMKFRTMKVNAEADTLQASKRDPRVTKLGHFLRKTSIDELPQFLNVLQGSMSVVGPRPHMLRHTEEYGKLIEKFMGRHYVKPGITGLAQCLGYRGETKDLVDMENRVRMDRYYIENWTFWFDIKIIFLTVISLIRGSDKAY